MNQVTLTTVKANNNYNKAFGIEAGKTYEAEKIETAHITVKTDKYGNEYGKETWTDISWNVNGSNYQEEDFSEI